VMYTYSCNKRQRDAQFLKIYLIKYSACFGQVYRPSSGVSQHCIHTIGFCHASSVGCLLADKYLLHVYSVEVLLMMDSRPVRNM
jgi:hypothetical protein